MDSHDIADASPATSDYAADISSLPLVPVSAPKVRWVDADCDEAAPVGASVSMAPESVAHAPYNPPDSRDMYIADWRRVGHEQCPAISFVPEVIHSDNPAEKAIQRYRGLFVELADGRHLAKEYEDAANVCAVASLSCASERNCVSTATKILLFLRESALRAHESVAYLYDSGARSACGSDLPHCTIEDILNSFKLAELLLEEGTGSWAEFVAYFQEGAACDIGGAGIGDAQTRQTQGWGPRKAKTIREMRCKTWQGPGKTASILRQFCVWNNSPMDSSPGVLCFEDATLRFPPTTGGFAQIPSSPDNRCYSKLPYRL